jgi:predicted SAM-dependent methyltransferase
MPKHSIHLHLGCFDQPAQGWYNTDITPHIWIARIPLLAYLLWRTKVISQQRWQQHRDGVFRKVHYLNLSKALPFDNNSVKAVFSSHVLEHLHIKVTESLLEEIFRILEPGGYVRLVLPDLEYAMRLYSKHDPRAFLEMVFENATPGLEKNQHKWMFTAEYAETLLRDAGFPIVNRKSFQETEYEPFRDLDNRPDNSLYIEARKGS